jgi:hypothetical protein
MLDVTLKLVLLDVWMSVVCVEVMVAHVQDLFSIGKKLPRLYVQPRAEEVSFFINKIYHQ